MNFDDWINIIPDDEKDTLCLIDSWRAGASAMFKGLVDSGWTNKDYLPLVKEDMEKLLEGKE